MNHQSTSFILPTLIKRLIATIFIVFLSGCAALQQLGEAQKPTAKVTGVSIADLSLKSITLNARVNINNPNPFKLQTAGLDLETAINGHSLIKISQPDNKLTLPASGDKEIVLPMTIQFSDLYKAVSGIKGKNEVPYGLKGNVHFAVPVLGNVSLPLEYEGILPIPQLPDVKINDIKVVKAGFTSIKLQLDMLIKNNNSFAVDMNKLNFNLAAQGKSLGSGQVNAVSLESGKAQSVSLPITLSLSEIGTAIFSLLRSDKPMSFSLDGEADILPAIEAWKAETMSFKAEKQLSL